MLYYTCTFDSRDGFVATNMRGVIIDIHAGLGNRLFEYAGGFTISRSMNVPLLFVMDEENKKSIHSDSDYNYLFKDSDFIEKNDPKFKDAVKFTFKGDSIFGPFRLDEIPAESDKYIYIPYPFFQSYEFIKDYIPEIRDHIILDLSRLYKNDINVISEVSSFIHVRRGDFLEVNNGERVLPAKYFRDGLDILNTNANIDVIYIISDDIEWCKNQRWASSKEIIFFGDPDEMKVLYLMSQCHAGAVISNSTFSLWGAFLGAYQKTDMIVYPTNKFFLQDLPANWIKI